MIPLARLAYAALRSFPRALPLFRDPRVPGVLKGATVVLALLIVSPLDLLGDLPIVGLFDDAALLALLLSGFVFVADRIVDRRTVEQPGRMIVVRPTR